MTGIPEGIRDAIGKRLNHLSEGCNQILSTASVIGREFDLSLLDALGQYAREDHDQLLGVLEEALEAGLIEEAHRGAGRYQFSHALFQETLTSELSAARRVRLHARIAETLEELYGPEVDSHAAELAYHFARAEPVLGTEKLVRYSLLAGERALASSAYEDALTHFERGLVARDISLSGTEAAADEEAADLLFGLARAQSATFEGDQLREAFAALNRAFEFYAEVGNVAQAVAAAAYPIDTPTGRIQGGGQLIARALALVPADSHEAGRLLSRHGGFLGLAESDYEGAQQALGRALAIARRERDVPLEVQTLCYAADVSGQHLHWQESVDTGLRAVGLAADNENPYYEVLSRFWTAVSLLHMGDFDAAQAHALVLRDLAERPSTTRNLSALSWVPIVTLSCLAGDWRAGREYSDRSLQVSPLNSQLLGPRALLEHETGESAQGEVYLERLLESLRRSSHQSFSTARIPLAIATIARITGASDHLVIAQTVAEAFISEQSVRPVAVMYAKAGLALLAVLKVDQSAAEEHYAYLLGHRGTMIWTISSVDRILGLLSHTMGNMDQAMVHFEQALAFCRQAGYRPELAWSCHDYAEALLIRKGSSAPERARDLLQEALDISHELGMPPLEDRVLSLQQRASRLAKPLISPGGLTEREVEVVRLIAQGKTNRDIAEELVLSQRTVQRHIANLYRKLNVHNRAEATAFALNRLAS